MEKHTNANNLLVHFQDYTDTHTHSERETHAATCTQMSTGTSIYTNGPINLSVHLSIFSGFAHLVVNACRARGEERFGLTNALLDIGKTNLSNYNSILKKTYVQYISVCSNRKKELTEKSEMLIIGILYVLCPEPSLKYTPENWKQLYTTTSLGSVTPKSQFS